MIVVKVELWSAITGQKTTLGVMHISNDGTSEDPKVADYSGAVMRKPDFKSVTRHGQIKGHRRLDQVIWVLVRKMLQNMGY